MDHGGHARERAFAAPLSQAWDALASAVAGSDRARMLLGAVERALAQHGIARDGETVVLVACSGGADSVALADAVCTLLGARRVVLGHVDHGVRAGSEVDAAAVEALAVTLGARVRVARLALASDAEAAMRDARYAALEVMRAEVGAELVLTAHSEEDQAETVLLGLIRSGHPAALTGILQRRGAILRPILSVPRAELRAHLARRRLSHREDPTNAEPRYLRNRIRKELLPLLETRYRAGIARRLALLAAQMGPESPSEQKARGTAQSEAAPTFPGIAVRRRPWTLGAPIPDGRDEAVFDAEVFVTPIVRLLAPGDRIRPYGMEGRRKVRDVLREAGVPEGGRTSCWVVATESGDVVWVPGRLRSSDAPVRETTREVWVFSLGPRS